MHHSTANLVTANFSFTVACYYYLFQFSKLRQLLGHIVEKVIKRQFAKENLAELDGRDLKNRVAMKR